MSLIREYAARDAGRVGECFVELQEHERRIDAHLAEGSAVARRYLAYMFARCEETAGGVFVAEVDGLVVGFVSVWVRVMTRHIEENPHEYAYVSDLVVLPAYRGRGLGRALLLRAEEHARRRGAKILRIGVLAGNAGARRLYLDCGFEERVVELTKAL